MAKNVFALGAFVLSALISASAFAQSEAEYLTKFHGKWTGAGTVDSMLGPVDLDCTASAKASEARLVITGECNGSGMSRTLSATLRYDPETKTYSGSWRDGDGGAGLKGRREGTALALVVESQSGGASSRMLLRADGGAFRLSLLRNGAQRVSIAFQRG